MKCPDMVIYPGKYVISEYVFEKKIVRHNCLFSYKPEFKACNFDYYGYESHDVVRHLQNVYML